MESGLHGSERDANDLGDRGQRHPDVVMQDEDGALFGREPSEGALERIPVIDRDVGIRSRRPVDRQDPDATAPAPVPTQLLVTGIHEQPMEPDFKAFRVAEPWELAPGDEECLLDGVLCATDIAKDPICDGVAAVTVQVDELFKGDIVPISRSLNQPRSHGRPPGGAESRRFTD
jgi:hypothetical protein